MALSWISGYNNIDYLNQMIRSVEDTLSNDYNNLDNIPIIKIISSTSNPQNVWELKEGMYLIDGIVYVDNNTSYEVSNLFVSMTARLENGKYVLSAFIPFFKGLYEYILKSNSTEYEEHQIVILATHERMLTRYNETPYEPNGDYNPATKKYVDDKANEIITELDNIGVNKETIASLKEENRMRDIKLQALLSETSDRNISISEDTRYFDIPLSIDNGIVTINEMIGDTLVNVCDQEESVAITKSYTVENENHIALQGEYDGSCMPIVYGNTLVNHNANWDDSLQTGIETSANGTEDVEVEGIKGQEVSVVVEGNTVLNHALGKTSAVVSAIESENEGNYVDLTVVNDMSSMVEIKGRTMVNVCDQKDPIAITKSYTVENSGNHIALQGEYDGSCRPVIQGNTMVNLKCSRQPTGEHIIDFESSLFKENITYTFIFDLNWTYGATDYEDKAWYGFITGSSPNIGWETSNTYITERGHIVVTATPQSSKIFRIGTYEGNVITVENLMIFEGDLTQTPELIPTEYVEGLKNSFEDNLVTQEMVDNGEESAENLGKYKVEYKVTGKNKFDLEDITITSGTNRGTLPYVAVYKLKPNTSYTLSYNSSVDGVIMVAYITDIYHEYGTPHNTIHQACINAGQTDYLVRDSFNSKNYDYLYLTCSSGTATDDIIFSSIQLEEGTEATEYEPYKEYTKTFYLNSPLLEGDTIEDVNGVATHVKRYGKVVFDGSEDWKLTNDIISNPNGTPFVTLYKSNLKNSSIAISDKLRSRLDTSDDKINVGNANIGIMVTGSGNTFRVRVTTNDTVETVRQWLSENPTTVVYELTSPIYEPISTESILCDSYVSGHLDFDSAVPIEKVRFDYWYTTLKYLQPNTTYAIQFESDNKGEINIGFYGATTGIFNVEKGLNKITLTTPSSLENYYLSTIGIGFNASNIVVTEATDADFDYFEGLKSSYECEVTEDGKYKVDVKVTGKNLWSYGNFYNKDVVEVFMYLTSGNYTISSSCSKVYESSPVLVINGKSYMLTKPHTINIEKEGNYKIALYSNGYSYTASINNPIDFTDIQLEEGTEATSYEPYFESTKTFYLNSPLLEGDKLVTKNGKVYHYRKMGEVVLDGSNDEKYGVSSLNNQVNTIAFAISEKVIGFGRKGISDKFTTAIDNQIDYESISFDNYIRFRILRSKLDTQDVAGFRKWLQANPTTVVYELANPYYELIDEYNNTILNIPNTVAHLTHTSTVPVNNTAFTNYIDELNVLEANTQYRVMFDCNKANIPFTVTLGGTSQEVTSIKGTHSLLITTPSELVDKNLVIDGIGRCGIDNIRIFKGKIEYDYVKGLWSGYEERKLENLHPNEGNWGMSGGIAWTLGNDVYYYMDIKLNTTYTVILENVPSNFRSCQCYLLQNDSYYEYNGLVHKVKTRSDIINKGGLYVYAKAGTSFTLEDLQKIKIIMLEGDWTDNPPTYEEVMANEGKYAVKVKLDTNANIFGKGGRL